MTITIIPFMPDGWAASAGGFPAMVGNVAFLMKDVVLFAVSFYLLKQDVMRASLRLTNSFTVPPGGARENPYSPPSRQQRFLVVNRP
jgi:Protein of unknown function, DUF417